MNYRRDNDELYQPDRYLGIVCKGYGGGIIFDKHVYRDPDGKRMNSDAMKKYIKDKMKGKEASLETLLS